MMPNLSKYSTRLCVLALALMTACQDIPDTLEDTGKPPPLDLPPIEINIASAPSPILREELFGRWAVTSLDEWEGGDFVMFTDETTMFAFKCNTMSLTGELSGEGDWHAPLERYGTTEMRCQGEVEEQDKAILSVMMGPSKIERIGEGADRLRFLSKDHEMTIERVWREDGNQDLSQEDLIGGWDIIRFDDFIPQSRLNGDGQPSAYVSFYGNLHLPGALGSRLHIGCNYSGNTLRLELSPKSTRLVHVPQALDGVATQKGCSSEMDKRDGLFFGMMSQSPKLERLGEHRLRLWTDKHELILESAEMGQVRNSIRNFKIIEGEWRVTMASQSGFGLGGKYFAPAPFVISKSKIQYGDLTPYLKSPTIQGSKINGEITGDFGARNCGETRYLSPKTKRRANKENAICFILNTLTHQPVAEFAQSSDNIVLSTGEHRITLIRYTE